MTSSPSISKVLTRMIPHVTSSVDKYVHLFVGPYKLKRRGALSEMQGLELQTRPVSIFGRLDNLRPELNAPYFEISKLPDAECAASSERQHREGARQ